MKAPKKIFAAIFSGFAILCLAAAFFPYLISEKGDKVPVVVEISTGSGPNKSYQDKDTLRVMTLNLAHGRGTGFSQIFSSEKKLDSNLERIAEVIEREKPDLVGFQEADGPSFWSGDKDHVEFLASKSDFSFFMHGYHIAAPGLFYGTAILSKHRIISPFYHTFSQRPFLPPKGFSSGTILWPGSNKEVNIIVLHLDFASGSIRTAQIDEIINFSMSKEKRPSIILGDFNTDWSKEDSPVKKLCAALDLKAYDPNQRGHSTFPLTGKRIDWILIDKGMEFLNYRTLEENISDHLGVLADIRLIKE